MRDILLTIFDRTIGWIVFIDYWLDQIAQVIVVSYNGLWIALVGSPRAALLGQGIGLLALLLVMAFALWQTYTYLALFFLGEPFPAKVAAGAKMPSVWGNAWRYLARFIVAAIVIRLDYYLLTYLIIATRVSLAQ